MHTYQLAELGRFLVGLLGLVAAVRAARQPALPARLRRIWGAVAASFAVLAVVAPLPGLDPAGVVAYPLADLALLTVAAGALLRGAGQFVRRPLRLLAAGALVLFAGDAVHAYLSRHDPASSWWQFVCWLTAAALLGAATAEQGRIDGLTGLGNRRIFRATSNRSLARGSRTAILVIDMSGFKEVNDTLGHRSGDLVLVRFAEVLRRCVPRPGLACRLGGDEFAVVLPEVGRAEDAYEVAGRIAAEMGPVAVDGRLITLAAGIGAAVSAPGELTHDELVHRAGLAMHRAKSLGPDTRWAIWQESLEPDAAAA